MDEQVKIPDPPPPPLDRRLKLGVALFVLSVLMPLLGMVVVANLGLSATITTSVSGGLLLGGELLGIGAVAIMGKRGYAYVRTRAMAFLKRYGPPQRVGRARYTIGLVMFAAPILFAWLSIYIPGWIPGFERAPLVYGVGGDLLLLASLFVLGGSFWDKLRSLFVHDAEVHFPRASPEAEEKASLAR